MDHYQANLQAWDQVASAYQDYFMDLELYNDTYDAFCERVKKPGARVFEIGCGPGNITRYLLSKRPDFRLEGIDMAPAMVELAGANNPGAVFKVMDCREIDRLDTRFDAIVCGFCMPYLAEADCAKLVKDCAALLHGGGALYFSTIEGDYSRSGYETSSDGQIRMYVYYYGEAFFQKLLKDCGFEQVSLTRKAFQKRDGTESVHLIFLATKRLEGIA